MDDVLPSWQYAVAAARLRRKRASGRCWTAEEAAAHADEPRGTPPASPGAASAGAAARSGDAPDPTAAGATACHLLEVIPPPASAHTRASRALCRVPAYVGMTSITYAHALARRR